MKTEYIVFGTRLRAKVVVLTANTVSQLLDKMAGLLYGGQVLNMRNALASLIPPPDITVFTAYTIDGNIDRLGHAFGLFGQRGWYSGFVADYLTDVRYVIEEKLAYPLKIEHDYRIGNAQAVGFSLCERDAIIAAASLHMPVRQDDLSMIVPIGMEDTAEKILQANPGAVITAVYTVSKRKRLHLWEWVCGPTIYRALTQGQTVMVLRHDPTNDKLASIYSKLSRSLRHGRENNKPLVALNKVLEAIPDDPSLFYIQSLAKEEQLIEHIVR